MARIGKLGLIIGICYVTIAAFVSFSFGKSPDEKPKKYQTTHSLKTLRQKIESDAKSDCSTRSTRVESLPSRSTKSMIKRLFRPALHSSNSSKPRKSTVGTKCACSMQPTIPTTTRILLPTNLKKQPSGSWLRAKAGSRRSKFGMGCNTCGS